MFRMYVLTALRRLLREKFYVFICVFSLAIGFASFLVISLYLRGEVTYDQHHVNHEQIYRLYTRASTGEESARVASGFGPLLVGDNPQLGEYVRFAQSLENTFSYGQNTIIWDGIWLADENVMDVFTHKIIYGDPETALSDPYSIALSQSVAESYFGEANPVGKLLTGANFDYTVTLVFEDLPQNTHLKYKALLPYSMHELLEPVYTRPAGRIMTLINNSHYTYFRVQPGFDVSAMDSISDRLYESQFGENFPIKVNPFKLGLQPLASVHFGNKLAGDQPTGNIFYLYSFAAIGIFLLLAASINYINLATARAARRAQDVGIRKVLGANRTQLMLQLLGESLVFTVLAIAAGFTLATMILEFGLIDSLTGKETITGGAAFFIIITSIFCLFVGLVAGIYPAISLSSGSPMQALKINTVSPKSRLKPRHFLILLQLTIAIVVVSCTLLIVEQLTYMANKPLGFDKENRVAIQLRGTDVIEQLPTLANELSVNANVLNVSSSQFMPGDNKGILVAGEIETNDGSMTEESYIRLGVGSNFISTMGIELMQGRDFPEEVIEGRNQVIVNESMVQLMGWDAPIGKSLQSIYGLSTVDTIIGVVPDFHYSSLRNPIQPMSLSLASNTMSTTASPALRAVYPRILIVNISGNEVRSTLDFIGDTIRQFDPDLVYDPTFLEDRLNQIYESESNLTKLSGIFAIVTILISLMGLFGLTAYTTEQRTKEIGIRKILGATISNIIALFWKNILVLIAIAAVPSSILSFYVINMWLNNFAYRVDLSVTPFLFALAIVSLLALTTVIMQSLKAALANPVDALRYE